MKATRKIALRSMHGAGLVCLALLQPSCSTFEAPETLRLNGRVEAVTVDLAPKVTGRVVEVLAVEGDRVEAGQLLVRLDLGSTAMDVARETAAVGAAEARLEDLETGSRQAEIEAAHAEVAEREAAATLARSEFERQRTLLEKKVGSQRDFDRARADLDRARAALEASRKRAQLLEEGSRAWQKEQARDEVERARTVLKQAEVLSREAEIRAPADAVVLHRIAEPGLLLAPGQSAMTVGLADRLFVRVFVPETRLGRVRQGLPARVLVDSFPGKSFAARVTEISPEAEFTPKPVETRDERVNLVYAAKVDLDRGWEEPLVPGQPAEVLLDESGADGR
jgi:HlyD family secretion protein